jgi:hypothetical protein
MQHPDFTCRVNSTLSVDSFNQRPVRQAHWAHRAENIFFADAKAVSIDAWFNHVCDDGDTTRPRFYRINPQQAFCYSPEIPPANGQTGTAILATDKRD